MAITDHGALYGAVAFVQADHGQGHQADRRRRDVRGPAEHARQGGQGRQPALPPRPAGRELGGLPEPLPSDHRRAPRRLLLQAPHRPRAPGEALEGPDRPVAPALAARSPRRSKSTTGSWPASRPAMYRDIFGTDRFFLELQDHGLPEQRRLNEKLLRLGPEMGLGPVVTNDLHYVRREQSRGARRPAVRRHRQQPRHARPDALRVERVLPEVRRRDGGPLPGQPGRDPPDARHRRDGRVEAAVRPAAHPELPGARRRDDRDAGCARSARPAWRGATARSRPSCRPASTTSSTSSAAWATPATS